MIIKFDRLIEESVDENDLAMKLAGELAEVSGADFAMLAASVDDEPETLELQALVKSSSNRAAGRRAHLVRLPQDESLLQQMLESCLTTILAAAPGEPFTFIAQQPSSTQNLPVTDGILIPQSGRSEMSFHILGLNLEVAPNAPAALLLAHQSEPFDAETFTLVQIVSTRLESALRYFRTARHLAREALGLRTVLKIDRIRDTSGTMDEMLNLSLNELCRVIPSQAGFVMLYDKMGNQLKMQAITNQGLLAYEDAMQKLSEVADRAINEGTTFQIPLQKSSSAQKPASTPRPGGPLHSGDFIGEVMGVPLILQERIIGVLGVISRSSTQGFSPADQELLQAIASQMDTAIFERLQTQRLREAFGRSVGPQVMEHLLQIDDRDLLRGDRVEITTLFSDIRGFTTFAETLDPSILESLINDHLGAMTHLILENDGLLDKFTGDGMMALFNVPARQENFALKAVRTALAMQQVHQQLQRAIPPEQPRLPPIGIGVATGVAVAGSFGSAAHAEYTAIGMSVNRSARLCGVANSHQVLVDARTYELVAPFVEARYLEPVSLKGITHPVENWEILGLKS